MREEAKAHRTAEATARAEASHPKSVSKKFPFTSQGLHMYCGAAVDEDLPKFWRHLATISKNEGTRLLQELLDERALEPSSTKVAPKVTPALYEQLTKFQFGQMNADDLVAGISPFLLVVGDHQGQWCTLRLANICKSLKWAAAALYPITNLHPDDVTTRGLCAGGAMALLCAKVDPDIIRLVGCWHSDEMIHYLHPQCYPLMCNFTHTMVHHGQFNLLPTQNMPEAAQHLLNQVPVHIAA